MFKNLLQNNAYNLTDIRISNVIVLQLYLLACKNMLVGTNDFFYGFNELFNNIITVIFILIYLKLFLFSAILKKIKAETILFIFFILIFFILTVTFDVERFTLDYFPYTYVKRQLRTFIAYCLPLFFVTMALDSTDYLVKKLFDCTFPCFVIATISFFFAIQNNESNNYSMSYGYAIMLVAVILLFKYSHTKRFWDLAQFLLITLYILLEGSRGPLFCIAVAVTCALLVNSSGTKKIIFIAVAFISCIICFIFYQDILDFIASVLEKFGIYSRTLYMLLENNITSDSDRSLYHKTLLEALNKSPILGLGAFGGESVVGLAHSLYIDILANFGYIFGTAFIVYIIGKDVYLIFKNKGTSYSELLLILSVIILPRGIFDDAFWSAKELWMIMALFIQGKYYVKNKLFNYGKKQLNSE